MPRPKTRSHEELRRYQREWQRASYKKNPHKARRASVLRHRSVRAFFLDMAESKCSKCGYNTNPAILQFDHIVPVMRNSKNRVGGFINWASSRGINEDTIAEFRSNIQVLCPNCHAEKTLLQLVKHE